MRWVILTASLGIGLVGGVHGAELRTVHGRVLDGDGIPVAGADVSYYWTANGPFNDPTGKPYDLDTEEGWKVYSANLGTMSPLGDVDHPTKTGKDGRFSIQVPVDRHHLMVMDPSRGRGGLTLLPPGKGAADVEIHLGPLVQARGSIEGPGLGENPSHVTVLVSLLDDPARPLDFTALLVCGSVDGRFEFSLPPGRYLMESYKLSADCNEKATVLPVREVLLPGEASEINLGTSHLGPYKPHIQGRISRAKAAGTWTDYTRHYGEKPPRWHVDDARGVSKDAQIADYRGKWLLVYFWGLSCTPCLKGGIPKLIKFYEDHQDQRDRFEIVAFCMDPEGEMTSLAELDRRLETVVKNVWDKSMPFPVLLDSSFTTWERFGLPAFGVPTLVDPQGHLVEGDETTLAERLK
ncbi:TlpA family protein disulfide reductase [Singulisphaera rosea]